MFYTKNRLDITIKVEYYNKHIKHFNKHIEYYYKHIEYYYKHINIVLNILNSTVNKMFQITFFVKFAKVYNYYHPMWNKILKSICYIISPCWTNIINRSLTTGVFPDNLNNRRYRKMMINLTLAIIDQSQSHQFLAKFWESSIYAAVWLLNRKITPSCINNNMAFLLRSLLLRPFYISCNTCIRIIFFLRVNFINAWQRNSESP